MKQTYVYHDNRVIAKRLRQVELDVRRMNRERATLVGFLAVFTIAAMLAAVAAPHVWPLVSDAIAYSISTPHYR